nr:aquaporin [Knoellia sp. DB2414S]
MSLTRRLGAEAVGTGVLAAAVVGSGVMAQRLTDDVAVQLLVNALATVAALGVLVAVLGPVSGAHLNPVVSVFAAVRGLLPRREVFPYAVVQLLGACVGVVVANLMFELPAVSVATRDRAGLGTALGEVVATAGLVVVVAAVSRPGWTGRAAVLVPAWIGGAYFFTSSTSFANPALTVGRALSDSFAGIAPASVVPFVAAQAAGLVLASLALAVVEPRQPQPAQQHEEDARAV